LKKTPQKVNKTGISAPEVDLKRPVSPEGALVAKKLHKSAQEHAW